MLSHSRKPVENLTLSDRSQLHQTATGPGCDGWGLGFETWACDAEGPALLHPLEGEVEGTGVFVQAQRGQDVVLVASSSFCPFPRDFLAGVRLDPVPVVVGSAG